VSILETPYQELAQEASRDLKGDGVSALLKQVVQLALRFLTKECDRLKLKSSVPGKEYFSFRVKGKKNKFSRPINSKLFDPGTAVKLIDRLVSAELAGVSQAQRGRALYSAAMSYCCATDLLKSDDRKTPATFFEIFVGHLASRAFNINPHKKIDVLALAPGYSLPTDFVFDLGPAKSRIHLPVKISTRERIIQVWAHQRVLDGVYGINRFRGILVCLTETNMVRKDLSVLEVCLPEQWAIYQMFISQLYRIYYFDLPVKYAPLAKRYPIHSGQQLFRVL